MDAIDGLNYVSTVANIDPRSMSKGMFRFVRAAARAAARANTGSSAVEQFRFAPVEATEVTPAQARLAARHVAQDWLFQPDAWGLQ